MYIDFNHYGITVKNTTVKKRFINKTKNLSLLINKLKLQTLYGLHKNLTILNKLKNNFKIKK